MGLFGNAGDDSLTLTMPGSAAFGGGGHDVLVGSDHPDVLDGDAGDDVIQAYGGDDGTPKRPVTGGAGDDIVEAGAGDDLVDSGSGDDVVDLGLGRNGWAKGGSGDDELSGDQRGVGLFGDDGADTLTLSTPGSAAFGGEGDDVLVGSDHPDVLDGDAGADTIDAGAGDDGTAKRPMEGGSGDDSITGGPGTDLVDAGAGNDHVDLGTGSNGWALGGPGKDLLSGDTVGVGFQGGSGNDVIQLSASGSAGFGDGGNDTVTGSAHADLLRGGAGDDTLRGEGGADKLYGETGVDFCSGGPGRDLCNGGPRGTDQPSPRDPDTCDSTVETKRNCKGGQIEAYEGTAHGTFHDDEGLVEQWEATYSMAKNGSESYWGDLTVTWSISGTDRYGCSHSGSGTFVGDARVDFVQDDYTHTLGTHYDSLGDVLVSCPGDDPYTAQWITLPITHATTPGFRHTKDPSHLTGTERYHDGDGKVVWSYDVVAR